jgi:RNA polymerase sigma-70 factor (ECF subfamily)
MPTHAAQSASSLSDEEIVQRILGGDTELYQIIIRRYNGRLYRVAWSIVHDEPEAEDVIQETYVRAYEHLAQFAGRSLFSTWLTRIAIQEAWSRSKRWSRQRRIDATASLLQKADCITHTPEQDLLTIEVRTILEQAIGALPEGERSVMVMRSLEGISTAETANYLEIAEETIKMRLFRARRMLGRALYERARATGSKAFQFLGERCDRVTARVLSRIAEISGREGHKKTRNCVNGLAGFTRRAKAGKCNELWSGAGTCITAGVVSRLGKLATICRTQRWARRSFAVFERVRISNDLAHTP